MRLRISHDTVYEYDRPAKGAIQIIRVTPRSHAGQHVVRWRIETSQDCRLAAFEDAFGNAAHSFTLDGPLERLSISVTGEVETQETQGIVRGTPERFPPTLFLRDTELTQAAGGIAAFSREACADAGADALSRLHAINEALYRTLTFDTDATTMATSAAEALARKRGVCQDYAHIFIAAARQLGMPARYVAGHLFRADGETQQEAGHAWAEAHVRGLGWVAFDPANGICATDAYVRVAVGLDSLGAAPIRGTVFGGAAEHMAVTVRVERAQTQSQRQG